MKKSHISTLKSVVKEQFFTELFTGVGQTKTVPGQPVTTAAKAKAQSKPKVPTIASGLRKTARQSIRRMRATASALQRARARRAASARQQATVASAQAKASALSS